MGKGKTTPSSRSPRLSRPPPEEAFPSGEGGRAQALTDEGCPATENKEAPMNLRLRTVGRLPCVKGAVGRRLTEGSLLFILARFLGRARTPSSVPGCARSTFPAGEGCLRREGKAGDHRQDMTGHLPLRSSKRFTGGYQFSSTVPVRPWRFLATWM